MPRVRSWPADLFKHAKGFLEGLGGWALGSACELSLIEAIAAELDVDRGADRADGRVVRGIGDDAAVVRARGVCVTSVDAMIEGVHFRLGESWMTPTQVGWRALAAALSDLAAMGAEPGEAYLVLGLPAGFDQGQRSSWCAALTIWRWRRGPRSWAGTWSQRPC